MRRRIQKPLSPSLSPVLPRLGLATPPPFVGRSRELRELLTAITGTPILVVNGAVGTGKTRLAAEFARQVVSRGDLQVTSVACAPGDLGVAVFARCERALDRMPGTLTSVLNEEAHLLVLDDVHHLPPVDVARLVTKIADRPGVGRLLLLTRDVLHLPRSDSRHWTLTLEGLDEASGRDLWSHLEDLYGPTRSLACDDALGRTRGMPLALRREYARARYGQDAWELGRLPKDVRCTLEAVSVARLPVGPAAVRVLLERDDVEDALIDLVSRQLIDPLVCGRFEVHDVVRDQVLEAICPSTRTRLERRAVELIRGTGRGDGAVRPAWIAGDDGALALLDDVDRTREVLLHLIGAGDTEQAVFELSSCVRGALARGAGGELLAHIEHLRSLGVDNKDTRTVAAQIAVRHGRIAEAIELGTELDATLQAYLRFRSGDVVGARQALARQLSNASELDVDLDSRALAAAVLTEIELERGELQQADVVVSQVFEARGALSKEARGTLHLAFAQIESFRGNLCAARAALSRAQSAVDDHEFAARVLVRRMRNLVDDGRFREAHKLSPEVKAAVMGVDCIPLRDEWIRCKALMMAQVGSADEARTLLQDLIASARKRGDEVCALHGELELALVALRCGALGLAAESSHLVTEAAASYGLLALKAHAQVIGAAVAVAELRIDMADDALMRIERSQLPQAAKKLLETLQREIAACGGTVVHDTMSSLEAARLALIRGDAMSALKAAKLAAVEAERLGRSGDLSTALAIAARLDFARGDLAAAMATASRAARESLAAGAVLARAEALLVLSALARDDGDVQGAATYARDAKSIGTEAGHLVVRMVATQALEAIAAGDEPNCSQSQSACAATASAQALAASEAVLADLGFTAARPFRCVNGEGVEHFVAAATPELLGMQERTLVVDAVRQTIVRNGNTVAELRRRSLLKRLLFLFAAVPRRVFSKEEIVEKVWNVEYHPLRHDAALFTNIMRIRRLLGEDGSDLLQVSEEGYSLLPPVDFLYVEDTRG